MSTTEIFAKAQSLRHRLDTILAQAQPSISSQQQVEVLLRELEFATAQLSLASKKETASIWLTRVKNLQEDARMIRITAEKIFGKLRESEEETRLFGQKSSDDANQLLTERRHLTAAKDSLAEYIAQGQAMFGNIQEQNTLLKATKGKILDLMNSAGINSKLIKQITGREASDSLLLSVCMTLTLLLFFVLFWFQPFAR